MSAADVVLGINGVQWSGWESVRVTRGMEQLAGSFELSVSAGPASRSLSPIRAGDRCHLFVGGEMLIHGYVDDRNVSYSSDSHSVSIAGRDTTADLVDCSAIIRQSRGQTLTQVAVAACAPFGIDVIADVDVGAVFDEEYAEPGQTVFDLLSTLAAHRGVLLTSTGKGALLITGEKNIPAGGALIYGQNIEACQARDSMRDRYSNYKAMYQGAQNDQSNGAAATERQSAVDDAAVRAPRPLIMIVDEGGDLDTTVKHERNVRAGRARSIVYTVSGWTNAAGGLWQPNTVLPVTDPHQSPALDNSLMLIANCAYIADAEGTRTELTVMRRGSFDVLTTPADTGGL